LSKHKGHALLESGNPKAKLPTSSQSDSRSMEELILNNEAWHRMLQDRRQATAAEAPDGHLHLLNKFNIQYIKHQMKSSSSEIKRSPMLVAVIQTLDLSSTDPTCQLLDQSGSIAGMIHSDVMVQFGSRIQPGSVLVLSNVAILMMVRNHYVNITMKNIAAVYWAKDVATDGQAAVSGAASAGVFSEIVFRLTDGDVMEAQRQLNREEAQAVKRAKELERQAVAQATAVGHQAVAGPGGAVNIPRMQTPLPPFRPPTSGPRTPVRPVIQPPHHSVGGRNIRPQMSNNSNSRSVQQHQHQVNQRPLAAAAATSRNQVGAAVECRSSVNGQSSSESNELLDGLDEESLFGDF